MKIMHLSDLHLGKRVNEFSMIDDQEYILTQILSIIDSENIDGVIIAGDIYDKTVPSPDAVALFDGFLVSLEKRGVKVFIVSGNHDCGERLAFANKLIAKSGIYFSRVWNGEVEKFSLNNGNSDVNLYLLPFLKPSDVRRYFESQEINSYSSAIQAVVESIELNPEKINILISHQFVTGATRCDSEDISCGGSDNINFEVFQPFDYVALGHLHSPQNVAGSKIRYCGSPLKYSFSEANHKKSVTILNITQKENIIISTVDLIPKRDLKEIKGQYSEIVEKSFYSKLNTDDYFHITLTDEQDVIDAIGKLRVVYPNIMKLDYDNVRTRKNEKVGEAQKVDLKSPIELFAELFEKQNNQCLTDEQHQILENLIEEVWGGVV